ncbi:MAG TPA: hypothetical protein VI216_04855 [Candidatus Acidoferrales bacterium]
MDRQYDLFQVLPDGTLLWREAIVGHMAAIEKLERLALLESCEFRLLYLPDKTVIATINTRKIEAPKAVGA